MKQGSSIVTYYWKEDGRPDRLSDKLLRYLNQHGLAKVHDAWDILDSHDKVCGQFYVVSGPKLLVDFMCWLTDVHFAKSTHKLRVEIEDGKFEYIEDIS